MKEKYNIVISERQAVPRSKRMRESGQSISSAAVLVSGSSGGNSSCDGHTHTNLPALERIGFDENDDKYLTVRVGSVDDGTGELIITHERAKAGYADKAHDLDDDSPVNERFLRKDIDDETAFLLKLLGGLIVDNGLDVTKGISTDTLTATTATTQILNVLDKLIAKSATFSDNVTVSKKTTTLNLLGQELAETHDLSVSHVATLMGTIVKDYISSESFVSGFVVTERLAHVFKPGDHGGTFGGNALACAAIYATLTTIKNENILEQTAEKGDYFKKKLEFLMAKYPDKVIEIRGCGLILGMELAKDGKEVVEACLKRQVIVNCTAGNVIRLVPPLIVTKEEIDQAVAALDAALAEF